MYIYMPTIWHTQAKYRHTASVKFSRHCTSERCKELAGTKTMKIKVHAAVAQTQKTRVTTVTMIQKTIVGIF